MSVMSAGTTHKAPIVTCAACGQRNRLHATPSGTPSCATCHQPLPWLVDAVTATFDAETRASVPVLVDFWAPWCGPCRMVAPVLEELAREHAGRLKVVKVDIDREPSLATRFGVASIPALVVLRDGREVDRIVGALPRAALERKLGLS